MDQSQFEALWDDAAPRVRTFLAAACRDSMLVDDFMQEVAMVAWRKRGLFDVVRRFVAWFLGMARFVLLRLRRDMARKRVVLEPDLIERLETLATADAEAVADRHRALASCVSALGESARTLLKIRYEARTPLAEAARQLGRSHGAIRTALARLRDSLRRCIQDRINGVHRGDEAYEEEI
jgi:RNA polymerase sigma-70 factor (ECF subfamily)